MNIKSVFSIFFITFTLCGFFTSAPAQSASMPEVSEQFSEDLSIDVFVIEVEEDPVQERIIFEQDVLEDVRAMGADDAHLAKPPRLDPYAVIEAARHPEGKRRAYVPFQGDGVQQLRGRLNTAVVEAKARIPEIKRVGLSPVHKLRDRLTQIQQTVKLKVSSLLERIGSSATDTAQQLREPIREPSLR